MFPISESFSNAEGFLYDLFAKVRQNISDKKSWYPPPMQKVLRYRITSETMNGPLLGLLVLLGTLFPTEKKWFPPPMHKIYRNKIFFETEKGSSTNFSGTKRQSSSNKKKRDISLVGVNLFDRGKVLKHRKLHPPKFSVLRDYNFPWSLVIPSLYIQKHFPIAGSFSNTAGFPYDIFRQSETEIFRRKVLISPLWRKFFGTRILLKHWMAMYYFFLVLWYKIFQTEKCDFPLQCI